MGAFLCPWMDGIPQGARKAVRLCTGCTVCCGAMDGKEQRMSKDVRYVAVPWMAKSNACPWMDGMSQRAREGGATNA